MRIGLKIGLDEKQLVDIDFTINRSLALVGQSGSGKSLTLKALMDMLPEEMTKIIEVESDFSLVRGDTLAFVPQNPFTALSPLTKIGDHFLVERSKQISLLDQVGLKEMHLDRYPPELSGGQLQRIILMIALEKNPKLLLLDEPTTALDPSNRILMIELLTYLQEEMGFKLLFVTHDMESARGLCEDIAVLKEGVIIERGNLFRVLNKPQEDYTKELIESNFAQRAFRT